MIGKYENASAHLAAADAILARLFACFPAGAPFPTPRELRALDVPTLRACGFSARKAATLHALADAATLGTLPSRAVADAMTDEELIARLTPLPGIGIWTVEMMLIYTLARLDVFPADDFAVREGYRRLKSSEKPPTRAVLLRAGEPLRPFRTIASWYLWRVPRSEE